MKMSMEEFVLSNRNILVKLAKYYSGIASIFGIEFDDLYQAGCLALIENYNNYDETKSSSFTYATTIIRISMIEYINKNKTITHIPKNIVLFTNYLLKEDLKFYQINGRYMTDDELFLFIVENNYTGNKNSMNFLDRLVEIYKFHFNDSSIPLLQKFIMKDDYNDEIYLEECLSSNYNLEDNVISNISYDELLNIVKKNVNDEINYDIFMERIGMIDDIPKTTKQLAKKYNTTHQTISKKYLKTLKKLRKKINISE